MINRELTQHFIRETREFEEQLALFEAGQIDKKTFKQVSGKFGCYAQRENGYMLRLRLPGGQVTREHLAFLGEKMKEYAVDFVKLTTCQTIQVHNLDSSQVLALMRDCLKAGIITRGGGGDGPRNVMADPLSGVDKKEFFAVLPYALAISNYLISRIPGLKLPRKLKVGFSGTPENPTHVTFRDLGFLAQEDGTFSVYCAGGLGPNPKLGVLVAEHAKPEEVSLYVSAMLRLFTKYGNDKVRAKSRTRYLQDSLGIPQLQEKFTQCLKEARKEEKPCAIPSLPKITKQPEGEIQGLRILEQKQPGLYCVSFHPIGGCLEGKHLMVLCEVLKGVPQSELRLSPDGSLYVLNLTAKEVPRILEATEGGAENPFEASVCCIGLPTCQHGIGYSQRLLSGIIQRVRKENFPRNTLPQLHISGCPSSCGTHQSAPLGFVGSMVKTEGQLQPAFRLFVNGSAWAFNSRLGTEIALLPEKAIPDFLAELGREINKEHTDFYAWYPEHEKDFRQLVEKYAFHRTP